MYKKFLVFLISFLYLFNFNFNTRAQTIKKDKALIIYDRKNYFSYSNDVIKSMKELFGAFDVQSEEMSIEDYKKQCVNKYSFVFVVGIEGNLNNKQFLQDLKNYKDNICWIGNGVDYFIKGNPQYNLEYQGKKIGITNVYYSNDNKKETYKDYKSMKNFLLDSKQEFVLIKANGKDTKIFSYISDGKNYYPYVLNNKNFWYVSRIDDNSVLFYIFSDLLNEIFSFQREENGKVYIRIEDVHPFRDSKKLKDIADYLYEEGVPFMVALIPTFVDTKTGYVNTISDKKDFIDAIRYMQDKGGSVILHGYTHQNTKEISGEGFEFWDGVRNEPLDINMQQYVYSKVGSGVKECVVNGIYPLGFEAPHYAMDSRGYREIKKYFSTYVGQYQSSDKKFTTTPFPYIIRNTENFNKLIPENLGYVEEGDKLSLKKIQENFKNVSIAKGYTAGMFFHCYLDIENLKEMVNFFKEKEVEFLSLKDDENWVKWNDISIKSMDGEIKVDYPKEKYKKLKKDEAKNMKYINKINLILIIIVSMFSILFLFIFIVSKNIDKNKFLR